MKLVNTILKILLLVQIAICILTPFDSLNTVAPLAMTFLFISLGFWLQIEPSVKYKEAMQQVSEAHYEFSMRVFRMKPSNTEVENAGKARLQASVIFGSIFISIALIVYIVVFLVYIDNNFSYLIFYFFKPTRIIGALILLSSCGLLIDRKVKNKRNKEKLFSEANISQTGLIIENILLSMITFIY